MIERTYSPRRQSMLFALMRYWKLFRGGSAVVFLVACCLCAAIGAQQAEAPDLFTYPELTALYEHDEIPAPLERKLNRLLNVPFVDNSGTQSGTLRSINDVLEERISDHRRMLVDIPLAEPSLGPPARRRGKGD